MKKEHINLTAEDEKYIDDFLSKGTQKVRSQKRALGLKKLNEGHTIQSVADLLEMSYPTVHGWVKKYATEGLKFLVDKPRSGRPNLFDGEDRAKITSLACTEAPEGYAKWSLRLLSERLVFLEYFENISHTQVGNVLKKTNFSPIEKKHGVSEP